MNSIFSGLSSIMGELPTNPKSTPKKPDFSVPEAIRPSEVPSAKPADPPKEPDKAPKEPDKTPKTPEPDPRAKLPTDPPKPVDPPKKPADIDVFAVSDPYPRDSKHILPVSANFVVSVTNEIVIPMILHSPSYREKLKKAIIEAEKAEKA